MKYELGEVVYLKTDQDQTPRMVTGIVVRPNGKLYYVSLSTTETMHYEMELSKESDLLKKVL